LLLVGGILVGIPGVVAPLLGEITGIAALLLLLLLVTNAAL